MGGSLLVSGGWSIIWFHTVPEKLNKIKAKQLIGICLPFLNKLGNNQSWLRFTMK
jgi:hypothetical protein